MEAWRWRSDWRDSDCPGALQWWHRLYSCHLPLLRPCSQINTCCIWVGYFHQSHLIFKAKCSRYIFRMYSKASQQTSVCWDDPGWSCSPWYRHNGPNGTKKKKSKHNKVMVHWFLAIEAWLRAFKRGNVLTALLKPHKDDIICGDEVSDQAQ